MKFSIIILSSLVLSVQSFAGSKKDRHRSKMHTYEVTITNLTKGQPMTPPVVVVSNAAFNLYMLGSEASNGLKELSKDGKTDLLISEVSATEGVFFSAVGTGLIFPNHSATITVRARTRDSLSLASMLAKTNDAFIGKKGVSLNFKKGKSTKFLTKVYDAGAEINNESKDFIPAFGAGGVDTEGSEGFVHPHPGVYGIADLAPLTDAFASHAARVSIKRVD